MGELVRCRLLQRKIFLCAQAGVDRENDGKRQCRLPAEDRNSLFFAVFLEQEILFLEVGNRAAVCVSDRHENVD